VQCARCERAREKNRNGQRSTASSFEALTSWCSTITIRPAKPMRTRPVACRTAWPRAYTASISQSIGPSVLRVAMSPTGCAARLAAIPAGARPANRRVQSLL
jgi:hypothetical protein